MESIEFQRHPYVEVKDTHIMSRVIAHLRTSTVLTGRTMRIFEMQLGWAAMYSRSASQAHPAAPLLAAAVRAFKNEGLGLGRTSHGGPAAVTAAASAMQPLQAGIAHFASRCFVSPWQVSAVILSSQRPRGHGCSRGSRGFNIGPRWDSLHLVCASLSLSCHVLNPT